LPWADVSRHAAALLAAALLAGCAAGGRPASDARPPAARTAAATAAAPTGSTAPAELPPDSLLVVVTGRNAYTVQDATTSCEGLPELLKPYREHNLVVAAAEGVTTTIADALCVALAAKQRGGKAWLTHPDGLRSIDIQD
jgi:hypothetical protein